MATEEFALGALGSEARALARATFIDGYMQGFLPSLTVGLPTLDSVEALQNILRRQSQNDWAAMWARGRR